MKRFLLFSLLLLTACNLPAPDRLTATPIPATATAFPTATIAPTASIAPTQTTTLLPPPGWTSQGFSAITAAGLVIRSWELQARPMLDPLRFTTLDGVTHTRQEMGDGEYLRHQLIEGSSTQFWTEVNGAKLVAAEQAGPDGSILVTVTQSDQEIYRIAAGISSPIPAVRMFWALDNHWFLETNLYTEAAHFRGQLSRDGVLLNNQYDYSEIFNSQPLGGKPFFLFQRNGVINAWYNEQEIHLRFETVPHYYCCSQGQLNPVRWVQMQAFFATRDKTWYFVQIGTLDALK